MSSNQAMIYTNQSISNYINARLLYFAYISCKLSSGMRFSVLLPLPTTTISVRLYTGVSVSPRLLALLLGAMVSPTDPVAVLSLMRQLGVADRLRTIVEGESLFNDGVGATAFEYPYLSPGHGVHCLSSLVYVAHSPLPWYSACQTPWPSETS